VVLVGFIEGFHSLATLAFIAGSALVAFRLLGLARRTGQEPELLLGGAILCTAVLGYGVLITNLVLRGTTPPEQVSFLSVFVTGAGRTLHAFGVTLFLVFVVHVFRRDEEWAKALGGFMLALLWGGLAYGAWNGSFRYEMAAVGQPGWWCEYAVIWTYSIWSAAESYRYWLAMRRRVAIGLADPLVANRFFLWGTGSVFTTCATWTASIPFLFVLSDPEAVAAITPPVRIVTAIAGIGSVSCSLFAFLPPAWYKRMIEPLLTRAAGATSR
jgi:hypothetical protein